MSHFISFGSGVFDLSEKYRLMTAFKNILVPTDFSNCATNALHYAADLALTLKAKIHLYHTYHLPILIRSYAAGLIDLNQELKEESEARLKKALDAFKVKYPTVDVQGETEYGLLMDQVPSAIKRYESDLIVMGTKGASGLDEYLVGSNAAYLIEATKLPVLVIPEQATFTSPKKIAFTTDFQFGDVESLKKLAELMGAFKPEITVVHLSTHPITRLTKDAELMDWFKEMVEEHVAYPNISFQNKIRNTDNLTDIDKFITDNQMDMVAMSTRQKSFLKKLFTGSLTRKMAYHTHLPLLAFHLPEDNRLN